MTFHHLRFNWCSLKDIITPCPLFLQYFNGIQPKNKHQQLFILMGLTTENGKLKLHFDGKVIRLPLSLTEQPPNEAYTRHVF